MTKVEMENVKCIKCGEESEQMVVYSVNFNLGNEEDNERLVNHMQKCEHCGYEAHDISKEVEEKIADDSTEAKEQEIDSLIGKIDNMIKELEEEEKKSPKNQLIKELTEKVNLYEKILKHISNSIDLIKNLVENETNEEDKTHTKIIQYEILLRHISATIKSVAKNDETQDGNEVQETVEEQTAMNRFAESVQLHRNDSLVKEDVEEEEKEEDFENPMVTLPTYEEFMESQREEMVEEPTEEPAVDDEVVTEEANEVTPEVEEPEETEETSESTEEQIEEKTTAEEPVEENVEETPVEEEVITEEVQEEQVTEDATTSTEEQNLEESESNDEIEEPTTPVEDEIEEEPIEEEHHEDEETDDLEDKVEDEDDHDDDDKEEHDEEEHEDEDDHDDDDDDDDKHEEEKREVESTAEVVEETPIEEATPEMEVKEEAALVEITPEAEEANFKEPEESALDKIKRKFKFNPFGGGHNEEKREELEEKDKKEKEFGKGTLESLSKKEIKEQEEINKKEYNINDINLIELHNKDKNQNYRIRITRLDSDETSISYEDLKNPEKDIIVKNLDDIEYPQLVETLKMITNRWECLYEADDDEGIDFWEIIIDKDNGKSKYTGNSKKPSSWDMYEEFLSILLTKFN